MDIRGVGVVNDFSAGHADAGSPLRKWLDVVAAAHWTNFVECRQTFSSADQVAIESGTVTAFNIKGNKYRLVAAISYPLELVVVRCLLTHAEYSKDRWKDHL